MGIRAALGAGKLDVIRDVLVSDGKPVVKGLLVGLWLSGAAMLGPARRGANSDPLHALRCE